MLQAFGLASFYRNQYHSLFACSIFYLKKLTSKRVSGYFPDVSGASPSESVDEQNLHLNWSFPEQGCDGDECLLVLLTHLPLWTAQQQLQESLARPWTPVGSVVMLL